MAPRRRQKLMRKMRQAGVPSMLVTHPVNVTYLTGFTGDSSYLLLTADRVVLLSDTRYETQIAEQCPDLEVEIRDAGSTVVALTGTVLNRMKLASVAVESSHLSKSTYEQLATMLDAELVDTDGWVEQLRAVKDRNELAAIRHAIDLNQRAFEVIRHGLVAGQTESDVATELEYQIRRLGGDGCAFAPIIAVGARSALPHAHPGANRIDEAPFMLVDWGTRYAGYCSDLTRVFGTARIPPKLRKIHEIVLRASQAAIRRIRPGVSIQEVDAAAREVIDQAGYGPRFGHGLGHGFGLEIHERPFLSPIQSGQLLTNMVVTIEPGIYLPGWGGVRIEDDILVTRDGHEVLSSIPRSLDELSIQVF